MAKKKVRVKTPVFEEALAELEQIVGELENGELGLAESLERYETGVKRLSACYKLLEKAERRIELVSGMDADGNPITQPFDDDEDSNGDLASQADSRSRKRTAKPAIKRRAAPSPQAKKRASEDEGSLF